MEKAVDSHQVFGTVLTDLSKAFDCICHDLLFAKLNAYRLSLPALKLIADCLQNRKQKTKIRSTTMVGKIFFQEFHKVEYLGPCYLISFYETYFLKMKIIILQITLMTPLHTLLADYNRSIRKSIWYY